MMRKNNVRTSGSKKIRRGDKVLVIAGNAKGQTGVVLGLKDDAVVVQGVNMRKKHVKPSQQNPKGGVVEFEGKMHISNVSLVDESGNRIKVKSELDASGKRQLVFKNDGKSVVYRSIKKPKQ